MMHCPIIRLSCACGSGTMLVGVMRGSTGNSSAGRPWTSTWLRPERNETWSWSSRSIVRGAPALWAETTSASSRAGSVVLPASSTSTVMVAWIPISRSVALRVSVSPLASSRMLLSIGSVLRDETARATVLMAC